MSMKPQSLSASQLSALSLRARRHAFNKGQVLIQHGDLAESLWWIDRGEVEVVRGEFSLAKLGPGTMFGEFALLDPAPRSATIRATCTGSAYELSRERFEQLLYDGDHTAIDALVTLTNLVCSRLGRINTLIQEEVSAPPAATKESVVKRILGRWRKEGV